MTSTLGALIAGTNSQARLVFNAGREGLLPGWIGHVNPARRTPMNAIFTFVGISGLIIGGWAFLHLIAGTTGSLDPITFFAESSTMGTILVLVVYLLANLALPFYYRRYRPQEFSVVKHGVLPFLGAVAIIVPLYYLAKPGQPTPVPLVPVRRPDRRRGGRRLRLPRQLARSGPGRPGGLYSRGRNLKSGSSGCPDRQFFPSIEA